MMWFSTPILSRLTSFSPLAFSAFSSGAGFSEPLLIEVFFSRFVPSSTSFSFVLHGWPSFTILTAAFPSVPLSEPDLDVPADF